MPTPTQTSKRDHKPVRGIDSSLLLPPTSLFPGSYRSVFLYLAQWTACGETYSQGATECNAFTLSSFRKLEFLGIFPTASNRKLAGKNQLAQSQIIKSNTISSPLSATNSRHQHLLYWASITQFVTSKPWANSSRLCRLRKNSCLEDSKRRNEKPDRTYLKTNPFQFILQLQITISVLNLPS